MAISAHPAKKVKRALRNIEHLFLSKLLLPEQCLREVTLTNKTYAKNFWGKESLGKRILRLFPV